MHEDLLHSSVSALLTASESGNPVLLRGLSKRKQRIIWSCVQNMFKERQLRLSLRSLEETAAVSFCCPTVAASLEDTPESTVALLFLPSSFTLLDNYVL